MSVYGTRGMWATFLLPFVLEVAQITSGKGGNFSYRTYERKAEHHKLILQDTKEIFIIMNERVLRYRAEKIGLKLEKGYQKYMNPAWGYVLDEHGEKIVGYQLWNMYTGLYVWGSYSELCSHLLTLEGVEEALMCVYEMYGIEWKEGEYEYGQTTEASVPVLCF